MNPKLMSFVASVLILFLMITGSEPQEVNAQQGDAPATAETNLKLPSILSDNMVMQVDKPVRLWGWAAPGTQVTAQLQLTGPDDKAVESPGMRATTDEDGTWEMVGEAPLTPAGASGQVVITAGEQIVTIDNVLVGEVWICSGQSNMDWALNATNKAKETLAKANQPQLRLFKTPRITVLSPRDDTFGKWVESTPNAARAFSAVGFHFGLNLLNELKVPVGMVQSAWGGTPAEAWTPLDALATKPSLRHYVDRYRKTAESHEGKELTDEEFRKQEAAAKATRNIADPGNEGAKKGWQKADFDDSDWKTTQLPSLWEKQDNSPGNINGAVWYRRTFELPADGAGRDLVLQLGAIDDVDVTYVNGQQVGSTGQDTESCWKHQRRYTVPASLLRKGENVIAVRAFDWTGGGGLYGPKMSIAPAEAKDAEAIDLAGTWKFAVEYSVIELPLPGRDISPHTPSALYNGMIEPLQPLPIRGAIWYQGESNASRAYEYRTLFPTMITSWRDAWGEDFPFLWVQLANFLPRSDKPVESDWAELREAQSMTLSLPNTRQAVIIDIGEADDIHPRNKFDVGKRLALGALEMVYDKDVVAWGPRLEKAEFADGKVVLTFDQKLVLRESEDGAFALAGEDKAFAWADVVKVDGKTLTLSAQGVKEPVAVRYAWQNNPPAVLYNAAGLPASPFRTDTWPGRTQR